MIEFYLARVFTSNPIIMANTKRYLTPWLQVVLDYFKASPSEKTYQEMMEAPLPEKIKSALREAYADWESRLIVARKRYRETDGNRND